jgi:hypothetical protein
MRGGCIKIGLTKLKNPFQTCSACLKITSLYWYFVKMRFLTSIDNQKIGSSKLISSIFIHFSQNGEGAGGGGGGWTSHTHPAACTNIQRQRRYIDVKRPFLRPKARNIFRKYIYSSRISAVYSLRLLYSAVYRYIYTRYYREYIRVGLTNIPVKFQTYCVVLCHFG